MCSTHLFIIPKIATNLNLRFQNEFLAKIIKIYAIESLYSQKMWKLARNLKNSNNVRKHVKNVSKRKWRKLATNIFMWLLFLLGFCFFWNSKTPYFLLFFSICNCAAGSNFLVIPVGWFVRWQRSPIVFRWTGYI